MLRLKDVSMKPKLIVFFLISGIIPMIIVGWWSIEKGKEALLHKSYAQLESIRDIQKKSIERYFNTINDQIITFSENGMIIEHVEDIIHAFHNIKNDLSCDNEYINKFRYELKSYYDNDFSSEYKKQNSGHDPNVKSLLAQLDDESIALQYQYIKANKHPLGSKDALNDAGDGSTYSSIHAQIHPIIQNYLKKFGYYDIFLVDAASGDIVYSVFKELDYSTSLKDGPYSKTNFAEAFRRALKATSKDDVFLVDYEPYLPSYEAPASFIASPVFVHGKLVAVAIFQMPLDRINTVMSDRAGLGESGEAYLVGPDKLMRSDSYLDPVHHSVRGAFANPEKGAVDTEASRAALAGNTGVNIVIDYNGNPVLSAYAPVKVGSLQWALMAEIDEAEVLEPIHELKSAVLWLGIGVGVAIVILALPVALTITTPLRRALRFSEAIARGELNEELNIRQKDEIGALADAMRQIPETLGRITSEVKAVSRDIGLGKLRARADSADLENAYADMAHDINLLADNLVGFMDAMPTPLMTINKDFSILFINKAGAQAGDTTPQALEGTHKCSTHFATGDCGTPQCASKRAMDTNSGAESETDAHPGGQDLEIRYMAVPITDENGEVQGAFEIVLDQTQIVQAQRTMHTIATEAGSISSSLSAASEELSAQVEEASGGASVQQERASETATAMEQMNATVLEVAKNSSEAAETAAGTKELAQTGAQVMTEMRGSIDQVHGLMGELKNSMSQLGDHAENIGHIMNVINDIADQTNLLALNAAIEAARAGEAGRGFAVVADEVRKLAEKTVGATKEVGEAISLIQAGAKTNIEETERAVDVVSNSTSLAQDAESALQEILQMTDDTADQVRAIATAAEEQSAASEQVTRSSDEINRISSETLETMVQSSQAINELAQLSSQLNELIDRLQN